jgi:hypothetical protein
MYELCLKRSRVNGFLHCEASDNNSDRMRRFTHILHSFAFKYTYLHLNIIGVTLHVIYFTVVC